MDRNILKIKWCNGQMKIDLDSFFPTTQTEIRKLFRVMDKQPETTQENIQKCIEFAKEKCEREKEKSKKYAHDYLHYKQVESELKEIIDSKKHPNGVKVTKEELKDLMDKRKDVYEEWRVAQKCFKTCQKRMEQLTKNIDFMERCGEM